MLQKRQKYSKNLDFKIKSLAAHILAYFFLHFVCPLPQLQTPIHEYLNWLCDVITSQIIILLHRQYVLWICTQDNCSFLFFSHNVMLTLGSEWNTQL